MVGVLFYFTARDENYINKMSAHPDVIVERHRIPVELGVRVPAVHGDELGSAGGRDRARRRCGTRAARPRPAAAGDPGRTRRCGSTSPRLTSSTRSGSCRSSSSATCIPGHPNHFEVTPTKTGTLHRPLHRAVRCLPRPDAVQRQDRDAGPVPPVDHRAAGAAERIWGCSVTTFDQPARPAGCRSRRRASYRKGSHPGGLAVLHRPQGHRPPVPDHLVHLLPDRRADGPDHARPAVRARTTTSSPTSSTTSCSPCTARSCCCCSRRRCSSGSPTRSCRCRSARPTWRSRG